MYIITYCTNCGTELPPSAISCVKCGTPISSQKRVSSSKAGSSTGAVTIGSIIRLVREERVTGSSSRFWYNEPNKERLAEMIRNLFESAGYQLESGTTLDGVYGFGSTAARILVGGFAKRYMFSVRISQDGSLTKVQLGTAMTGLSGSIWGVMQLEKEFKRWCDLFR